MDLTRKQLNQILIGAIVLSGILGVFNFTTPFFYRLLPNDYVRTKYILNHLSKPSNGTTIAILGASTAMCGMDADVFRKYLPEEQAFNLSSTGQSLIEGTLYYTKLPETTKIVIQCVGLSSLATKVGLRQVAALAFKMYGYECDDMTKKLFWDLGGYDELDKSQMQVNFDARTFIKAGFGNYIRSLFDDDAPSEDKLKSLKFPYLYPEDRSRNTYERDVAILNKKNALQDFKIDDTYRCLVQRASHYFESRGIQYVLVIMPVSPDVVSSTKEEVESAKCLLKETFHGMTILDCYSVLSADDFYDAAHPNRLGAAKLTDYVAKNIKINKFIDKDAEHTGMRN